MTEFRKKADAAVPHFVTKYDECTLHATGKPYRHQKGSGRSEILALAADGMKLGHLTKLAAAIGHDPNFTVQSCLKQHNTKDGGWMVQPPAGKTLKDITSQRETRKLSPEKQAEREAKAKVRAEEQAKKKIEREAKAKAKEEEKAKAKAAKDAAKQDASKKPVPDAKPEPQKGKPAPAAKGKQTGHGQAHA